MRAPGRALVAWVVLATGAALTGCGHDAAPPSSRTSAATTGGASTLPVLARDLDAVDAAVTAGDDAGTRAAVRTLMAEAARAGDDGRIDQQQADAITQVATELLDRLPPAPSPTPERSPSPPPIPHGHGKPDEQGQGKGPGEKPGHGHGDGEDQQD